MEEHVAWSPNESRVAYESRNKADQYCVSRARKNDVILRAVSCCEEIDESLNNESLN
jgi:hypothetical protein